MKARLISYSEVEKRFLDLLSELDHKPRNEETIQEKSTEAAFLLDVCIAQLNAPSSSHYQGKDEHLGRLERASNSIRFKLNTCTIEEISDQVSAACKALAVH